MDLDNVALRAMIAAKDYLIEEGYLENDLEDGLEVVQTNEMADAWSAQVVMDGANHRHVLFVTHDKINLTTNVEDYERVGGTTFTAIPDTIET